MSGRWRFIAGARCPQCGALDTLRMRAADDGRLERDCVDCTFHDVQAADDIVHSLGPRADSALGGADLLDDEEQVVRIVAPDRDKDS